MLENEYLHYRKKKNLYIIALTMLILVVGYLFSTILLDVPLSQTFTSIRQYVDGTLPLAPDRDISALILTLRLPRILMAVLSGFALAVAGTVMQSITRNYLVSPFTVGIASASAFGASLCIILGISSITHVIGSAFTVSILCLLLLYGIASRIGMSPSSLILVGISLNYLFSALIELIKFFARGYQLENIIQWSFGSLARAEWDNIIILWFVVVICTLVIIRFSMELDILSNNTDEVSKSLGINYAKIRVITGALAVLMTATVICFTGVIGFVGLIAPHMARILIGGEHDFTIVFSGLLGSLLMLVADTVGHYIFPPNDIPVAIILSFIGVPLFINLILKMRRRS